MFHQRHEVLREQAGEEGQFQERNMSAHRYHGSRQNDWFAPRPHRDANQRYQTYGPIQPMEEPGFLWRLFRPG
jgi:hypothetical protein